MSALKKTILITVSILILIILYYFIFVLDLRLLSERQHQTSSIQKKVEYEECTKEQSKNIHKIDGYSIQFFGICSNTAHSHLCEDSKPFCGASPDRGQEHYPNYGVMMTVKDQDNNIVLKGINGNRHLDSKLSNPNKEIFGDVVMLVNQPSDFPYLVLKDTMTGSWGTGYWYHLYSTKNGFKKVTEIGPSHDGLYQNKDGDYLIDVHRSYLPPSGNMSDKVWYSTPYKLVDDHFVVHHKTMESNLIKFTKEDINQYLERSKRIRKYIVKLLTSEENKWILNNPFRLFIYPRYKGYGYPFDDIFKLIRNGREDLSRQYFDILIPDEYNENSHLFEEHVNTKDKLWNELTKELINK